MGETATGRCFPPDRCTRVARIRDPLVVDGVLQQDIHMPQWLKYSLLLLALLLIASVSLGWWNYEFR